MATKSMLKDIAIKDSKFGLEFANALETAVEKHETGLQIENVAKKDCIEVSGDKVKEFFWCK